jgi:hypothetical protein
MNCAKCKKDIGKIKSIITTGGHYVTDKGGQVEITLEATGRERLATVIRGSELCAGCLAKIEA